MSPHCNRYNYDHIPHRDSWINHLFFNFFEISNSSKRQCLTIDMRYVNKTGAKMKKSGSVTIITTKRTEILVVSWLLKNKHH